MKHTQRKYFIMAIKSKHIIIMHYCSYGCCSVEVAGSACCDNEHGIVHHNELFLPNLKVTSALESTSQFAFKGLGDLSLFRGSYPSKAQFPSLHLSDVRKFITAASGR